jgi:dTDP-4-amino-4,6-dideoxygalactose transaminase
MIPRTKVNYRLPDLMRACLVGEDNNRRREALTRRLGEIFDILQVLLTASGRGALYILLSCLPQSRVLVPAYTCKAVVEAARLASKEVLFGESEENGFNMATDSLKERLNADTILLATHQFGIPCNIHSMIQIARETGAFVIEDAAASLGTRIDSQLTGTFGDAAFFSFDSTKLINVPLKGGFLQVRDPDLFARCQAFTASSTAPMSLQRKLHYLLLGAILVMLEQPVLYRIFHNLKFHWRGRFTDDSADFKPNLGPFYLERLAEWQADLLLPQIERLDQIIATRQRCYAEYLRLLQDLANIELPPADTHAEWAPIRFPIRVYGDKLAFYRRAARFGVDFAFSFTFIATHPEFVRSHQLATSVLNLPFYDRLTDKELERVVDVLRELDRTTLIGV